MKAEKTRVVFVLPSLKRAGAETQTVDLVNSLPPHEFEKHLFVFEERLDQLERVDQRNVIFHHVSRQSRGDIKPSRALANLIDEQKIQIVHCSLQIALFVGWVAVQLCRTNPKLVLALHTTTNRSWREEFFDRVVYQWMMRSCDVVICVCRAQQRFWEAKYSFLTSRTVVVYNGVDTEHFQPDSTGQSRQDERRRLGIPAAALVVCCVAAFRPEKGHLLLLDAFATVATQSPEVHLVLAGDGPLLQASKSRSTDLQVSSRVHFVGLMADIRPILSASDVAVIASTAVETFSIAMLEALSMQVPMVSTDLGGAREAILEGETGLVVEPGDAKALAAAIQKVLTDEVRRSAMGQRGRQVVRERFSRKLMVDSTADVLSNCLASGRVQR